MRDATVLEYVVDPKARKSAVRRQIARHLDLAEVEADVEDMPSDVAIDSGTGDSQPTDAA